MLLSFKLIPKNSLGNLQKSNTMGGPGLIGNRGGCWKPLGL